MDTEDKFSIILEVIFVSNKRKIEVFSAGCPLCDEAVELVKNMACPSCEVFILDMKDPMVAGRARELGVKSLPAVAVNGELAGCCQGRGINPEALKAAGLGNPVV
jgi:glutaredoxin 3